jgi:ribose transport system permease protein
MTDPQAAGGAAGTFFDADQRATIEAAMAFGGFGSVIGSIVGALMIGLINNGLILMGLEFSQQLIARGVIIILAVMVARSRK